MTFILTLFKRNISIGCPVAQKKRITISDDDGDDSIRFNSIQFNSFVYVLAITWEH
jgi:hypothetical protein